MDKIESSTGFVTLSSILHHLLRRGLGKHSPPNQKSPPLAWTSSAF